MKLTLIIPTRERPELLLHTVRQTLPNMARDDSRLLICVDDDDEATLNCLRLLPRDDRITVSVKVREDSRGEKYDRALTEAPADIYIPSADYAVFLTPAFDQAIINAARLWPDGIGVVYGPMVDELVPCIQAMTSKFVEKIGHIFNHDYPFWFIDHEVADIAWQIGRVNFADFHVDLSRRPKTTMRLRDVQFWCIYFDAMTLERRNIAKRIIDSPDFDCPDWLKMQMRNWYPLVEMRSYARNDRVKRQAAQIEAERKVIQPDPGYDRIKAKAVKKLLRTLDEMEQQAAA